MMEIASENSVEKSTLIEHIIDGIEIRNRTNSYISSIHIETVKD